MDEDDWATLTFVNVVHPTLAGVKLTKCEGVLTPIQPEPMVIHFFTSLRDLFIEVEPSRDIFNSFCKSGGQNIGFGKVSFGKG